MKIERLILSNLIYNEEFLRKTIPFIKDEYFLDWSEKKIFQLIKRFVDKYNSLPTKEAISLSMINEKNISDDQLNSMNEIVIDLVKSEVSQDWLIDETEKFCKDKAVYNAILQSIKIINDEDKDRSPDSIPHMLQEALSVGFDLTVGHDYLEDAGERYDFYHRAEEKLPFDIEMLNKITKGGVSKKTLNIFMAGTGVGKSLVMCHIAAASLLQNKNVLYITMEMSEEKIAERIDANLLNTVISDIEDIQQDVFHQRINKIKKKTHGRLIIKEYPTGSAHAGHFRALLKELNVKKNFKPDVIFIDYLNICASSRLKASASSDSYGYAKSIAEELRGLGVEFNVPVFSATQTNRSGYGNSDADLTNTSESFGVPATSDLFVFLYTDEELDKAGQILVKQLKNRYNDMNLFKRFIVGVDKSRMKLYDVGSFSTSVMNNPEYDVTEVNSRFEHGDFSDFKT